MSLPRRAPLLTVLCLALLLALPLPSLSRPRGKNGKHDKKSTQQQPTKHGDPAPPSDPSDPSEPSVPSNSTDPSLVVNTRHPLRGSKRKTTISNKWVNPPNSTICPAFAPATFPKRGANGTAVLATPGWVPGRLVNYRDPRSGFTAAKLLSGLSAAQCFNKSICAQSDPTVTQLQISLVSWQARTNGGTKGNCYMFVDSTCSPKYNPGVNPFVQGAPNWYTASISQINFDPTC